MTLWLSRDVYRPMNRDGYEVRVFIPRKVLVASNIPSTPRLETIIKILKTEEYEVDPI